jgi:hypothetical protein
LTPTPRSSTSTRRRRRKARMTTRRFADGLGSEKMMTKKIAGLWA